MLPVATLWKARTGDSNREERKNKLRNRDSTRQTKLQRAGFIRCPGWVHGPLLAQKSAGGPFTARTTGESKGKVWLKSGRPESLDSLLVVSKVA